jgi:nucleoside-diphosphate-sugar epimerase
MSRCFPEADELMAIYRLYRGVDIRDVAEAHWLALMANFDQFHVFNISAAPAFSKFESGALFNAADDAIDRHYPWARNAFARRGWQLPRHIDRVYVIEKAQRMLGYQPRYNFESRFGAEALPDG